MRVRARWRGRLGLAGGLGVALLITVACTDLRRANGEECLKDDDCLSGTCRALVCVALPPVLDANAPHDAAGDSAHPESDAGDSGGAADGPSDAPPDATRDGAGDGSALSDASVDG